MIFVCSALNKMFSCCRWRFTGGIFFLSQVDFLIEWGAFFPTLKKKKLFKVTQPFLNRNTSRLKLISCINYLMEMIHMNSCSNHRVISGVDRMEVPRARHGQSLLPQISRISKEGNAEDTNIFMQWLNQAAQTRSPGMGLHLGDGFWRRTADQRYQSSRLKVKETCGFFMTRRWILSSD